MPSRKFSISSKFQGLRLDKALTSLFPDKSRNNILLLIKDNKITVNGKFEKPSYITKENDEIIIDEPEVKELDLVKEDLNLNIVYEDEYVAVINKPKGMVVHPGAGINEHTLVNGLLYEMDDLSEINGTLRPGIVHRIDKDTTGLLMIAKNDIAMKSLTEQLKDHACKREYVALVYGSFDNEMVCLSFKVFSLRFLNASSNASLILIIIILPLN